VCTRPRFLVFLLKTGFPTRSTHQNLADLIKSHLLGQATVNVISASCDIFGFVAGEENSHRSDFFWPAKAAPRNFAYRVLHCGGVVEHRLIDRRGDGAGSNVVDADLVLS